MADSVQFTPQVGGTPDLGEGMSQALAVGTQLAQHQQQLDQGQQQLEIAKQQHKIQSAMKFIDVMDKAGKTKGPAQKALFAIGKQIAPLAGLNNIDPGVFDLIQSQDPDTLRFFNTLSGEFLADPVGFLQKNPEKAQTAMQALSTDTPGFMQLVQKFHGIHESDVRARINTYGQAVKTANTNQVRKDIAEMSNQTQQRGQDLTAKSKQNEIDYKSSRDAEANQLKGALGGADIFGADGSIDPQKVISAAKNVQQQKQNESVAKVGSLESGANLNDTKSTELPKSNAEKSRHNKAMEAIAAARVEVGKSKLSQSEKRLALTSLGQIDSQAKNYRDMANLGARATKLLDQPDMTPGRFKEGVTSLTALMRGTISRIPQGTESGVAKAYSDAADGIENVVTRFFKNNPGADSFDDATKNNLKADISRLFESANQQYRSTVAQGIETKRGTVLSDATADLMHKRYGTNPQMAGVGKTGPEAMGGNLKVPTPAFIQGLQKIQGLDIKAYLQKKGYDTSGVK